MYEHMSVILATGDAELHDDLRDRHPDVRILLLDALQDEKQVDHRAWAFVDWLLPSISGLEICRRIKSSPHLRHTHVTMILDDDDRDKQKRALDAGADDYVLGPVTSKILASRINLYLLAEQPEVPTRKYMHGDLIVDASTFKAKYNGQPVYLGPTEFRLLLHFMQFPNRVFSRQNLIDIVGKAGAIHDDRTVNVWVGRLRKTLAAHGVPDPLRTVRTIGYVLDTN